MNRLISRRFRGRLGSARGTPHGLGPCLLTLRLLTLGLLALGPLALVACSDREPDRQAQAPDAAPAAASATDSTFEVPDIPIDQMPKLLQSPVVYPAEALRRGEEGLVQVKALIGKDGRVRTAAIDTPRPSPDYLGPSAVEAVRQWTFEPARAKGEPVEVWIVVPVSYRLR